MEHINYLENIIHELKEKALENSEYHFNEYIIEDYSDSDFNYLIEDYDRYLYWIDLAATWNHCIWPYFDQKSLKEKEIKLLNDAIEIKKKIDKKLLELTNGNKRQIYIDLELIEDESIPDIKNYHIRINENQGDKNEIIDAFHSYLKLKGYISDRLDSKFRNNFIDSEDYRPITWEKPMNQLVALLKYLISNGVIYGDFEDIYSLVKTHFIIRKSEGKLNKESIVRSASYFDPRLKNLKPQFEFVKELADELNNLRNSN